MFNVSYLIAFASGLVSFFAPCVLPLLPAYIGYVTGVSAKELRDKGYSKLYIKKLIITGFFYILGFSLVFVILGTTVASVGYIFRRYSFVIRRLGGLVIFLLGLDFAGFLNFGLLAKQRQIKLPGWVEKLGYFRAFFVGVVFATAWTPCVGAILGSILALAAVSGTALRGTMLLFVYSLGISLPFFIVTLTLASAPKYLKFIEKHIEIISKITGFILAVLGLLLLTDTYKYVSSFLLI